jgi:hypothetical protein
MRVRSLCKHYDTQLREEGEEWEHSGPLYEHIVPVDEAEPAQKAEPLSRAAKPARTR